MSVSKAWVPYAVHANTKTLGASDVLLDQVQNVEISTGIAQAILASDGQVDPTYVSVLSQAPSLSFESTAAATILGSCGISGMIIDADVTYPGLIAWFQKMAEGGVRAAGSSHLKLTMKEGLLVPRTIQASQGGVATISLEAALTYDGTNDPIIIADSQALAGTPATAEAFTIGPASINGATLEGIQSLTIDPGISLTVLSGDGQVWPTYAAIQARQPSIRLTSTDVSALSTFGLSGAAQGASDSVVWLRKMSEGAGRVADNVAEHIGFTIDEGMITVQSASASQGGPAMAEVLITPTYDGTAAIIVVDTTQVIA
jgi:hypothetical protein